MSVFFSSQKTVFEKLAQHLLDTSSIAGYLSSFLKLFLIAISAAPRHLMDRSSIILASGVFLPRQLSTLYLSTLLFLNTCSTDGSTPPRHLICQDLLMVFIYTSCDLQLTYVDLSLIFSDFSSPKPLSLIPNLFPWDSQAFFKSFLTW